MRRAATALATLAATGPAAAHGGSISCTPADLWTDWSFDPWQFLPLLPLGDQRLAGAIMWAPMGAGDLAICLVADARLPQVFEPERDLAVCRKGDAS